MGSFTGKVAVVTGGGNGIGRAVCLELARQGATVVVADLAGPQAEQVAAEIAAAGGKALAQAVDVTDRPAVRDLLGAAVARGGGLDILVNCAGVAAFTPFLAITDAEWQRMLNVDLTGTFIPCQEAFGPLQARGGGAIVNVGSIAGEVGGVMASAAYAAAKAGVMSLTKSVAKAGAPFGIRCNAVSPGIIDTQMISSWSVPAVAERLEEIPLHRIGTPEEVADVIVFLAGPGARYVTGQIVRVNGGSLV